MKIFLALITLAFTGTAIVWVLRRFVLSQRSLERLYQGDDQEAALRSEDAETNVDSMSSLARWLYLAGFRGPGAVGGFLAATALSLIAGGALAIAIWKSGINETLMEMAARIPGGIGDAFRPILLIAPWMMLIILASIPMLYVRSCRRKRIQMIEQDLPITLELLSTLSEAGLGFDAAIARILTTQIGTRPLAGEFRTFQADLLSGRNRVDSLRRLAARIQMPAVSIFISALVQAQLLGMGIARVLRQQADDMRGRRRERAIAFANALPVKRLFPMVICFLPGLFVWTLGPAFLQLIKMADTFLQVR